MNLLPILEELNLEDEYIIVGVSKCGTTSATKFLGELGYHIEKQDGWFWSKEFIYEFGNSQKTKGKKAIVIIRNPIERAWSHYHFMFKHKPLADTTDQIKQQRLEHVSRLSAYDPWLNLWKTYVPDLVLLTYEDLIGLAGFPHENKTLVKPMMTPTDMDMIENYIELELSQPKLSLNIPQSLNITKK
jgi:hypothetical protein